MAYSLRKRLYPVLGIVALAAAGSPVALPLLASVVASKSSGVSWYEPVLSLALPPVPTAGGGASELLSYATMVGRQGHYKLQYEKEGGGALAAALGAATVNGADGSVVTKVRVAFILASETETVGAADVVERWQLVRGQVAVSIGGALQKDLSRQLSAAIREPFRVRLDRQGRVLALDLSPALSPAARGTVQDIVASVVVVLPESPRPSWQVWEAQGENPYAATYKVVGRTTGLGDKPLVAVQKVTSKAPLPRAQAAGSSGVGLAEGRLDVEFDAQAGRVERISGDVQGTLVSPQHGEESWRTSIRLVFLGGDGYSATGPQPGAQAAHHRAGPSAIVGTAEAPTAISDEDT